MSGFTRPDVEAMLINASRSDLPVTYVGPRPTVTFQAVTPTTELTSLFIRSVLGNSPQGRAFTACQLLAVLAKSMFSSILPTRDGMSLAQLDGTYMSSLVVPTVTEGDAVVQCTSSRIYANEYGITKLVCTRKVDGGSIYYVVNRVGVDETVVAASAGQAFRYQIEVDEDEPRVLTWDSSASDQFTVLWAAMPLVSTRTRYQQFLRENPGAVGRLKSLNHTLASADVEALVNIAQSVTAGLLAAAAAAALLASHLNFLQDARG